MAWAAGVLGGGVVAVDGLDLDGTVWRVMVASISAPPRQGILRLNELDDPRGQQRITTEAAALTLAHEHGVAAPKLLASDPEGSQAGQPALLVSVCPGTSQIPRTASALRLERIGAAVAWLHAIEQEATEQLPVRHRPLEIEDFNTSRESSESGPLLAAAERRLAECAQPIARSVLVHGDMWQGNTLWKGEQLSAIIDWDSAGVGHPGIDLASARLDAVWMFGSEAADVVLRGYQQHRSDKPIRLHDLAYFEVVAALASPADMRPWVGVVAGQGRPDLSAELLVARRDAFLKLAMDRLS